MPDMALVAVGASAGGVEALIEVVSGLDADLPAAVLVVLHQPAGAPTVLDEILGRRCALDVIPARDGDDLRPGRIHVATPDHHLQVAHGRISVVSGSKENGHRPGVDPLFRSVARHAGPRAIGVVLSGLLDDGAAGLLEIVRLGGTAVVQDPDEAAYPGMPRAALDRVPHATVRPAHAIGSTVREIATRGPVADQDGPRPGPGTGPLRPGAVRDDDVERALYAALQALEDKAALQHRVAESARVAGAGRVAAHALAAMRGALGDATVLRRLLAGGAGTTGADGDE